MSKLRDILIDRMVGDMSKILTFKNASKSPEELGAMAMPKVDAAVEDIKSMLLEFCEEAKDRSLPLTYVIKKITEL